MFMISFRSDFVGGYHGLSDFESFQTWLQAPVLEGLVASLEFLPPELLLEICTCDEDGGPMAWSGGEVTKLQDLR